MTFIHHLRLFQSPFTAVGIFLNQACEAVGTGSFPFSTGATRGGDARPSSDGGTCPPAAGRAQRWALSFPRGGVPRPAVAESLLPLQPGPAAAAEGQPAPS